MFLDCFSLPRFHQGARHTFAEGMGKNVANPTAMLLCAANMLSHAGLDNYSEMITSAVDRVIKSGKVSHASRPRANIFQLLLFEMSCQADSCNIGVLDTRKRVFDQYA